MFKRRKAICYSLLFGCLSCLGSMEMCQAHPENQVSVCVLDYLPINHAFSKSVSKIFKNKKHVRVIYDAVPLDFKKCIEEGVEEILLIAHAWEEQRINEPNRFYLGWHLRLYGQKREEYIKMALKTQTDAIADLEAKKICLEYDRRDRCPEDDPYLRKIKRMNEEQSHLPKDYPIYKQANFDRNPFREALAVVKKQSSSGSLRLKNIRFVGCEPKTIFNAYPELAEIINNYGIGLEVAPKEELMSFLMGREVTKFDSRWVEKSAENPDEEGGFSVYIRIHSLLFARWSSGRTTAQHGNYEVKMTGIGLTGYENKYTEIYVANQDVKGMLVGETRTITVLNPSISGSLFFNAELQMGRHPKFLGTTAINTFGTPRIGLVDIIEITKIR